MQTRLLSRIGCLVAWLAAAQASGETLFWGEKLPVGSDFASAVAVADLDGDGLPDLVTANSSSDEVSVLAGEGNGRFQAALWFATGDGPAAVAVADLDGDGVPDVVTANSGGDDVSVLLGNGDGTLQAPLSFPAGDQPSALALADLDGNGFPDVVTANRDGVDVSVLLGTGDGTLQAPVLFAVESGPISVAVADLDGDDVPDVVTANRSPCSNPREICIGLPGSVSLLRGNGDGTFEDALSFPTGPDPVSLAVADVDADGIPDLITANVSRPRIVKGPGPVLPEDDDISVLVGNGDGSFQPPLSFAAGSPALIADLDGDGLPDLVTGNAGHLPELRGDTLVLLGNGDGSFTATSSFHAGRPAAVADLDADGLPDLVATQGGPFAGVPRGSLSAYLGNGDGSFRAGLSVATGDGPASVAVADLDRDGIPDLVTANAGSPGSAFFPGTPASLSVLRGGGLGGFEAAVSLPTGEGPAELAVADVDRDGIPDLVTANGERDDVSVRLGRGDGSFDAPLTFPTGRAPVAIAVADLDADGARDLVTANLFGEDLSVLLGDGDGRFQPPLSLAAGSEPVDVAVADLDGDGIPDLVAVDRIGVRTITTPGIVRVLLGNGDGSFEPPLAFEVGISPSAVVASDLDGDGVPDLVIGHRPLLGGATVGVLLGNGDGSFQPAHFFTVGGFGIWSVAAADLDGDGIPDLATANGGSFILGGGVVASDLNVLLGNGDGSFQEPLAFVTGAGPFSVAAADLDGDRAPDLVTANLTSNDVSVLLNLGERPLAVDIDIRPWSDRNWIHPLGRGVIPVALLGSEELDVGDVDPDTLAFGPLGAGPVHRRAGLRFDVNRDGFRDLLSLYRIRDTGIAFGQSEACLVGTLRDGMPFEGCDSIETAWPRPGRAARRARRR